jgi:hypothetical protein
MPTLKERWRTWRTPENRRRRKTDRSLAWQEAQLEADARRDRANPRPPGFWDRVKSKPPR